MNMNKDTQNNLNRNDLNSPILTGENNSNDHMDILRIIEPFCSLLSLSEKYIILSLLVSYVHALDQFGFRHIRGEEYKLLLSLSYNNAEMHHTRRVNSFLLSILSGGVLGAVLSVYMSLSGFSF
ncbi:uncharacterized protein NESG_02002 [Nematocida ausubeli]|uniref:Uncharacterized protein n=1 Tax=Nematocida ausubeli (strain ATCC PRA-371 / ERTm2) TaxID=1913371 RepID=A0A086IZB5_NEMA1|nr:uncharacterized protein NESG_02002 [Nematocida ausubeli]KFG25233.1 hypothetical protein NESG_02002 [Nematocida ausubeli]